MGQMSERVRGVMLCLTALVLILMGLSTCITQGALCAAVSKAFSAIVSQQEALKNLDREQKH